MTTLERQAGNHAAGTDLPATVNPGRDPRQPKPLVTVIERMARVLLGVRCRIELVTFLQRPAETLGQRCCDRRLPAARDACDDEDWVKGSHAHNASRLTPLFPARRAEVTDAARS